MHITETKITKQGFWPLSGFCQIFSTNLKIFDKKGLFGSPKTEFETTAGFGLKTLYTMFITKRPTKSKFSQNKIFRVKSVLTRKIEC